MFQLTGPVLVAVSLDGSSEEPLRVAQALATAHDVPLHACHALPEHSVIRQMFPHLEPESALRLAEAETSARRTLNDFVVSTLGHGNVDITLEEGSPHSVVLRVAERIGAGLVVVSTSSRDGGGSLSAVSERIVRHAHCPVLVVRPPREGLVLAATDFSDPSLPAITAGASEAKRRGSTLAIVHAIELVPLAAIPDAGIPYLVPNEKINAEMARASKEQLEHCVSRFGARGGGLLEIGPAAKAILRAAEAAPAQLLVLGTRGRTGLGRLLLGSVAETVVREARCSVLVVRLATEAEHFQHIAFLR